MAKKRVNPASASSPGTARYLCQATAISSILLQLDPSSGMLTGLHDLASSQKNKNWRFANHGQCWGPQIPGLILQDYETGIDRLVGR